MAIETTNYHSAALMGPKGGRIGDDFIGPKSTCMVVLGIGHGRRFGRICMFIVMAGSGSCA